MCDNEGPKTQAEDLVMNKTDVLKKLDSLGTEQTRKTYRRHGCTGSLYGVKYGDLNTLARQIGTDHKLAQQLWETGNHDARTLATMIADPDQMTQAGLDRWAKSATNPLSLDAVAGLAIKTKHARNCFEKWIRNRREWTAAAGWQVLAGGCCGRPGQTSPEIAEQPDSYYEQWLEHIEQNIHDAPNRVRHTMNGALIAIGLRSASLQKKAIAAARRIGTVEVDHGETNCKTPDAEAYIVKAAARKRGGGRSVGGKVTSRASKKRTTKKKKKAGTKKSQRRSVARSR